MALLKSFVPLVDARLMGRGGMVLPLESPVRQHAMYGVYRSIVDLDSVGFKINRLCNYLAHIRRPNHVEMLAQFTMFAEALVHAFANASAKAPFMQALLDSVF